MRGFTLRDADSLLAVIILEAGVLKQYIDFPSKGFSMKLKCLFLNSGVGKMLEGKDCCALNMVFPNIGVYSNRATGFEILQK